jgi:hypothetical protein
VEFEVPILSRHLSGKPQQGYSTSLKLILPPLKDSDSLSVQLEIPSVNGV